MECNFYYLLCQQTIQQLKAEVSSGKDQEKQLERVVQELKLRESELEGRVREKEGTAHNLELVLQQVKLESERNLQNTVSNNKLRSDEISNFAIIKY